MTTDLDRLIEAVEVGNDAAFRQYNRAVFATPAQDVGLQLREDDSYRAYRDSIDAAVALLEALLPGWEWNVNSRHYWDKTEGPLALIWAGRPGVDLKVVDAKSGTPARALLLAILRAYRGAKGYA